MLTAHLSCSIGWLGAVGAFLALAVVGLTSRDAVMVRGVYLAAKVTIWFVIVPLSFGSLLTGIFQSLCTPWGLFRHCWVLATLVMNVFASVALLVHTKPVDLVAGVAARTALSSGDLRGTRVQLVVIACAALVLLLVATALSVYKPQGLTVYGWRKQQERRVSRQREQHERNTGARALDPVNRA